MLNRDKYGSQQQPMIQINAGSAHIQALQRIEAQYDRRLAGVTQAATPSLDAPDTPSPAINVLDLEPLSVTGDVTHNDDDSVLSTT